MTARLLFGADEYVARWVADQIPHVTRPFVDCAAIGVLIGDKIVAGVVYHEYRGNDIQMSVASAPDVAGRWLNPGAMRAFFRYPFDQLGCDRVSSFIPSRNVRTRRFIEKIGFDQEGVIRRGFRNDDCIAYGMLRSECKWIEDK